MVPITKPVEKNLKGLFTQKCTFKVNGYPIPSLCFLQENKKKTLIQVNTDG